MSVFYVMMVMKATGYALNNPAKEILYQVTSSAVKFKCKSWIDTFGQRGCKALGAAINTMVSSSTADLINYGSMVGVTLSGGLVWVALYMGREFEALQSSEEKVGEMCQLPPPVGALATDEAGSEEVDTSCVLPPEEDKKSNVVLSPSPNKNRRGGKSRTTS